MPNKKNGFTLIEIIVVIIVIAILYPAVFKPMMTILIKGADLEKSVSASQLAEMKMEHLSGLGFFDIVDVPTTNFDAPIAENSYAIHVDYVDGPSNLDTVMPVTTDYKRVQIVILLRGKKYYDVSTLFTNNDY